MNGVLAALVALIAAAASCAAAEPGFFACHGVSRLADPRAAAHEAAAAARAALGDRHAVAAVFLDGTGPTAPERGSQIGDAVRAALGVPTYGTGGSAPYTRPFEGAGPPGPVFSLTLIGGDGLRVDAVAAGGVPPAEWSRDPADDPAVAAAYRTCYERGRDLALQLPEPERPALLLSFGALHNYWHTPFYNGVWDRFATKPTLIAGVGQFGDYVYADGAPLHDADGAPSPHGQLALLVQGRMAIASWAATTTSSRDHNAVLEDGRRAAQAVADRLGRRRAELLIAFATVGRYHAAPDADTSADRKLLAAFFPTAPVLGLYCGGEAGVDGAGRLHVGGGRLCLVAVAAD